MDARLELYVRDERYEIGLTGLEHEYLQEMIASLKVRGLKNETEPYQIYLVIPSKSKTNQ